MKMAKIFGKVENPKTPKSSSLTTMKLCFNGCYDDSDCFLVEYDSDSMCSFYNFSTIQESLKVVKTEPESQMYVAFKTILPEDTCPVSFEAINLTYIHPDGRAYPWKMLSDGFSFPKCRYGWKLFRRADKNVCMKVIKTDTKVTKTIAELNCEGLNSLLIGVETFEEATWMWGGDTFLEMSYFVSNNREDCLVVGIDKNQNKQRLNDVPCTDYPYSTGMVCGYKLD
ncbi:hypothetical protein CAEBREN_05522 [Caenorhabditis brenneri]|uniref:PAN-3 domain-containing protein n=1 Tax=Caenorhabditis brenneri TaxID=135651 RepID=G0NSR5_CAEBE|nr:hypothetical protein CAEBREN_05522 [Caenorhabditis brenneri]